MSASASCDTLEARSRLAARGLVATKEIRRFKVAVNTACPLRCGYCFIDKDSGEVISWDKVEGLVRFFLNSPGEVKKLLIYGGEPTLEFELVKKVARFARAEALKSGKDLDLSFCTSGVGLTRPMLEFLKEERFFLSLSLDGDAAAHDAHRVLKGGAGSWSAATRMLPQVFEVMGARPVMAIQCVHPDNVGRMLENFKTLVGVGFENVEIEVIHGFGWESERPKFRPGLETILDHIRAEARAGRNRFLVCSLVPLMLKDGVVREDHCPFHSSMECYPDGSYSFYPFAFVDAEGRKRSRVGGALEGVDEKWRDCRFDLASDRCRTCTSDYYRDPRVNEGNLPYLWRTEMARAFMQEVQLSALKDPLWRSYLKEALVRCRIS